MGEDEARGVDWLRARKHHFYLSLSFFPCFNGDGSVVRGAED